MDNILFSHFPPVSEKQWKQQIQYILKGENYQNLIHTNSDGISTLPFYTKNSLSKAISINYKTQPSATYYCIVSDEKKANTELLEVINNEITTIYIALFNPKTNLDTLLKNINCELIIQCYFLEPLHDTLLLKNKQVTILYDCIGKISKTGNWYTNAKVDFITMRSALKNKATHLSINLTTFHNAGATILQQVSYTISQLIQYSKKLSLPKNTTIHYHVSLSTDMYLEIAKIKTLRILHTILATQIGIKPICKIIQHKSKRNLSGLHTKINDIFTATEKQIAILAGVDYYLSTPKHFVFYKEDLQSIPKICEELNNNALQINSSITKNVIYIEKLVQQLLDKSVILINNIEDGGGYLEQLKKGTIQQKTAIQEKTSTLLFLKNTTKNSIPIPSKKTTIAYPFLKSKKRKTLWSPIIEKQLLETIERPLWEKKYSR